jgi:zinc transporter, ZIP family
VSLSLLAVSNLREGMASSSRLKEAKWPKSRVMLMWLAVMAVSALSAAAGYLLLDPASGRTGALVQAFAAGALLAMLADTLLPEAYAVEGVLTGPVVVTGFVISLALSAI